MPVYVIDTLKPKNGLDFPIVEAIDVAVEGYLNLADAVTHFATDTAIATFNAALGTKANTSDVTLSIANLQGQIDQIVISASSESVVAPEVAAARVGADGESYSTLKERLDANQNIADKANDAAYLRTYSEGKYVLKHISSNGNIENNNNKNICFKDPVLALKGSKAYVDAGYKFQVALYNKTTKAFIERITWMTSDEVYVLEDDYYIRLEISDISESTLEDDSIKVHMHYTLIASEIPVNEEVAKYNRIDLEFTKQANINLNYPIGTEIDLTPESTLVPYRYSITDCSEYDVFIINATGGSNPRVWGFVDEDNILLSVADASTSGKAQVNLQITAPPNAKKLIVNSSDYTGDCYKSGIIDSQKVFAKEITDIDGRVDDVENEIYDKEISLTNVGNIKLAYPIGTEIDLTPESVAFYRYAVTDCSEYDIFKINATGGSNPRVWGFVDENNILLAVAAANTSGKTQTDLILIAPATAKKLIINSEVNKFGDCRYLGNNKYDRVLAHNIQENSQKIDILEAEISELDLDEVLDQTNNIVAALGIDTFRGKTVETAAPEKYKAWPFVGKVGDKAICVYSIGLAHEDNTTPDIYCKLSKNGVIWSPEKKIISTSIRDTVTGKGYDDNGDFVFWVRKGSPGGENTVHDLYKTSDGYTFELVASPTFEKVPSHIGDIVNVPNVGMFAFWNDVKAAGSRSWGYVKSTDNGETWAQTVVETDLQIYECPMEMSPVYLGDGKILVMGRQESSSSYGMFQIQSEDYGDTWEKGSTNITDIVLSTPSVLYNNGTLSLYYFQRGVGALRLRTASPETIWNNPTSWPDSSIIAHGTTSGQDTGNVNACQFGDIQIAGFYSGDSTNTGIYATIV